LNAPAHLSIPRTIQAVIRRRLEQLPGPARELAVAAAVFPRLTDIDLLTNLAGLRPAEAIPALESACAAGILAEGEADGPTASDRTGAVGLSHNLIRRVIRADLSAPRLRSLHQQAFWLLLRHSGAEPQWVGKRTGPTSELAAELATHARGGGLWEPAAVWYQAAAGAAERAFAHQESARLLEQALYCLERHPPSRLFWGSAV
jgi:hypothetical protein